MRFLATPLHVSCKVNLCVKKTFCGQGCIAHSSYAKLSLAHANSLLCKLCPNMCIHVIYMRGWTTLWNTQWEFCGSEVAGISGIAKCTTLTHTNLLRSAGKFLFYSMFTYHTEECIFGQWSCTLLSWKLTRHKIYIYIYTHTLKVFGYRDECIKSRGIEIYGNLQEIYGSLLTSFFFSFVFCIRVVFLCVFHPCLASVLFVLYVHP